MQLNILILCLLFLILVYIKCNNFESFTDISSTFSRNSQKNIQERFKRYQLAKDNPEILMPNESKGILIKDTIVQKDCSKCSWKIDNNCVIRENGILKYDQRCDGQTYTDPYGVSHKSNGYMCSAFGTDLDFEECNARKCKPQTLKGCDVSELPQLIQNTTNISDERVSGIV